MSFRKSSELQGAALDWAVAKCEGYEIVRMRGNEITFLDRTDDGALNEKQIGYSINWAQGGPIIEREGISINLWGNDKWVGNYCEAEQYGPKPMIAAMRCYVASKLGDIIDIPEAINETQ